MALKKINYVDNQTVITAENMNAMQDAIIEAEEKAEEAKKSAENAKVTTDKTLTNEGQPADAKATGDAVAAAKATADAVQENLGKHNTNTEAHADLRIELKALSDRINAALDSDDTSLDELSEIVAYIKSNKSLIDAITISKVSVTDIINDLVTNVANKPLSAAQGVALKALNDDLQTLVDGKAPKSHASTGTSYGAGTGSKYGHVKLSDATNSTSGASSGVAATPAAVKAAYDHATDAENAAKNAQAAADSAAKGFAPPSYYDDYLDDKIETIKELMDEAGNHCSSFINFSDSHTSDANGGNSGKLARYVMDKCHIDKVFFMGDAHSNSIQNTKEKAISSLQAFNDMVFCIIEELCQARGNHDGAWGSATINGETVTYAYNLPDELVFNRIGRKNKLGKAKVFGEDGFYFYMDDENEKTRYIVLNTHDRPYELNEDGTVKYNTMKETGMGLRQAQFDWFISSLNVQDGWSVAVFCHVPPIDFWINQFPTLEHVQGLLGAYKKKTAYIATYEGVYGGVVTGDYTNLFDTEGEGYAANTDISGASGSGKHKTNKIQCTNNEVIHVKGGTPYKVMWGYKAPDGSIAEIGPYYVSAINGAPASYDNTVTLVNVGALSTTTWISSENQVLYAYIEMRELTGTIDDVIITVNENIQGEEKTESSGGWDALNINADFSNYKGEIIGLFCGHYHNDYLYTSENNQKVKVPTLCITCDGRISNNLYMDATAYPDFGGRALGTVYEQALDVVVVNKARRTVKTVRIGAGYDREFSY